MTSRGESSWRALVKVSLLLQSATLVVVLHDRGTLHSAPVISAATSESLMKLQVSVEALEAALQRQSQFAHRPERTQNEKEWERGDCEGRWEASIENVAIGMAALRHNLSALTASLKTQASNLDELQNAVDNVDYEQRQCSRHYSVLLREVVTATSRVDSRRAKMCYWAEPGSNQVMDEEPLPFVEKMQWNEGIADPPGPDNQTMFSTAGANHTEGDLDANSAINSTAVGSSLDPTAESTPKILFISAIFGTGASRPYLQYFLNTAAHTGIDFLLFGDPPLFEFTLPPNVKHVHITWHELVSRIEVMVFGGRPLNEMRKASTYKVIDVKPLYGLLFQRMLRGYDFWAYGDSDMLLGDISKFITPTLLRTHDVISGSGFEGEPHKRTWGPFTVMRNVAVINELFKDTPGLYKLFNTQYAHFFDEWGGHTEDWYNASMSKKVAEMEESGKLRWYGGIPHGWDGGCSGSTDPYCAECHFSVIAGRSKLWWNRSQIVIEGGPPPPKPFTTGAVKEVALCHFQHGKDRANELLSKMGVVETVLLQQQTDFYQSYGSGIYTKAIRPGKLGIRAPSNHAADPNSPS